MSPAEREYRRLYREAAELEARGDVEGAILAIQRMIQVGDSNG